MKIYLIYKTPSQTSRVRPYYSESDTINRLVRVVLDSKKASEICSHDIDMLYLEKDLDDIPAGILFEYMTYYMGNRDANRVLLEMPNAFRKIYSKKWIYGMSRFIHPVYDEFHVDVVHMEDAKSTERESAPEWFFDETLSDPEIKTPIEIKTGKKRTSPIKKPLPMEMEGVNREDYGAMVEDFDIYGGD